MTGTILVTGAGGCIGAWVIARLLNQGHQVVATDLVDNKRRLALALGPQGNPDSVPWELADISDQAALSAIISNHQIGAIVHLAALQIPFCFADPYKGAQVNVVGQVNVFQCAREAGLSRVVYASSAAAQSNPGEEWPGTLYGVFKRADEGIAHRYFQDWGISSIGLRPHSVYGPGRDQGVTSYPTAAMLAAATGQPYKIAYSATMMMQHVHEVADAFIASVMAEKEGAAVCDLKGVKTTTPEIAEAIKAYVPGAQIEIGDDVLTLPVDQDDAELRALVGDWPAISLEDGIARSIDSFRELVASGLVEAPA